MKSRAMSRRSFIDLAAASIAAATMSSTGGALRQSAVAAESGQPGDEVKRIRTACRGCGKFECGAKDYINVDARMSNLGKEADYFLGVRPGTDVALLLSWYKMAMEEETYDDNYVRRWTNASFIVVDDMRPSGWMKPDKVVTTFGPMDIMTNVQTVLLKESDLKEEAAPRSSWSGTRPTDASPISTPRPASGRARPPSSLTSSACGTSTTAPPSGTGRTAATPGTWRSTWPTSTRSAQA